MKASFIKNLFVTFLLYFTFLTLSIYDFSNFNIKPANVVYCHELNQKNEAGDNECKKYEEEPVIT